MRRALVLAALLLLAARPLDAQWTRVDTSRFVLVTDRPSGDARTIASHLERFHEALAALVPAARLAPVVPLTIVVFGTELARVTDYPIRPGMDSAGGYFAPGIHDTLIVVGGPDPSSTEMALRHEYAHHVVRNVLPGLPVWIMEGLAEYYGWSAIDRAGTTRMLFGALVPPHVAQLADGPPLDDERFRRLIARVPTFADEREKRLFYAQAWALVRLLVLGDDGTRRAFANYILQSRSIEPADAWTRAFGATDVRSRLAASIAQQPAAAHVVDLPPPPSPSLYQTTAMADADVRTLLARHSVPNDDERATRHLAAVREDPSAPPLTRALLGRLAAENSELETAHRFLRSATSDGFDWLVQYHAAVGLDQIRGQLTGNLAREAREAAQLALDQVRAAQPGLPAALAMQARLVESRAEGWTLAREARRAAPQRPDYVMLEARMAVLNQDLMAQTLKDFTEGAGSAATSGGAPMSALDLAASLLPQLPLRRIDPPLARTGGAASTEGVTGLAVRALRPGEERIEGELVRLECLADGNVIAHVRTRERLWRFTSTAFTAITFISYRSDIRGVACGPRATAERVYATYTRPSDPHPFDGRVLVIEFLSPGTR